MGSALSSPQPAIAPLSREVVEDYRILTGLPPAVIEAEHQRFATLAQGKDHQTLTKKGFMAHPALKHHPLADRIATVFFKQSTNESMPFKQYLVTIASFSTVATRPVRTKQMFQIWDVDEDGTIGLSDLVFVLQKTTAVETDAEDPAVLAAPEGSVAEHAAAASASKKLFALAQRVLQEASSRPDKAYLSLEDFQRAFSGVEGMDVKSCILVV